MTRRSGRTTRMVESAIDTAKKGERVLIVVQDAAHRKIVNQMFRDCFGKKQTGRVLGILTLKQVEGGCMAGRPTAKVFTDHLVYEVLADGLRRQAAVAALLDGKLCEHLGLATEYCETRGETCG